MKYYTFLILTYLVLSFSSNVNAQLKADAGVLAAIDEKSESIESDVITWRRYLHEHPELSNREYETAKYIAAHLEKLGLQVETGVAHTGVVAVLQGKGAGPVVALRADMDALPAAEAPPHHTPDFYIDESGMPRRVLALCYMTINYLSTQ